MKKTLKFVGLAMLSAVLAIALLIGVLYLFGYFNEKKVFAENISFNTVEKISSTTFSLQVDTNTENVNQKRLKLETSPGGERIIKYPQYINIGEPFSIAPQKDENGDNIGGFVTITARYDDSSANQNIICSCNVLIDVDVKSVELKLNQSSLKIGETISFAKAGDTLSSIFDISPKRSMTPYVDRSKIEGATGDSIFNLNNFADKKIFMELLVRKGANYEADEEYAYFSVNSSSQKRSVILANLTFNGGGNDFVFNDNINIRPGTKMGEVVLRAYVISSYGKDDNLITTDNFHSRNLTSTYKNFTITNYTVDSLSLDISDKEVYFGEWTTLYLNNPNTKEDEINLNVVLHNNQNYVIDDSLLKNNLYISLENSEISHSLTRRNDSENGGEFGLNVDYDGISTEKNEWGVKFYFNDFKAYYNYKQNGSDQNKMTLKLVYDDGVSHFERSVKLLPLAREITSITPNYKTGNLEKFYVKNGEEFRLSKDLFELHYDILPSFSDLNYYIPFDTENTISTMPTTRGTYRVYFSFVPSATTITAFSPSTLWGNFNSRAITFTQGDKVYELNFDSNGILSFAGVNIEFEKNKRVDVELFVSLEGNITSPQYLFNIQMNESTSQIPASQVKFVNEATNVPYLSINNIVYGVDFEYFSNASGNFIHILEESPISNFVLQGSGREFNIVAQLIYEDEDEIYWLGKSCEIRISVNESLQTLNVFSSDEGGSRSGFESLASYNENEEMTRYIFVTSEEMEALKAIIEQNNLKIEFVQDFKDFRAEDYSSLSGLSLSDINKGAIEFGAWEEVRSADGLQVSGYKISYNIKEVYTIKIDGVTLNNSFKIYIRAISQDGEELNGVFNYSNSTTSDNFSLEIVDKTLKEVVLNYNNTTDLGQSATTPLSLVATISNGSLAWNVAGAGGASNSIENLNYGFMFTDRDLTRTTSLMVADVSTSYNLNDISKFYRFEINSSGRGGLYFYNVPYVEDGILFTLHIYARDSQTNNMYYEWNGATFVAKVNDSLREGKYFYIKVVGLNINITANKKQVLGARENSIELFGADGLFSINGVTGENIDYSTLFNLEFEKINDSLTLSPDYKTLTVEKDFLETSYSTFMFYYGSQANKLQISVDGEEGKRDSYRQTISTAFIIDINTSFDAPSSDNTFVKSIMYKGESDALQENLVSFSLNIQNNDNLTIRDNLLTFKSVSSDYNAIITLTLAHIETGNSKTFDYEITVYSKYTLDDLSLGKNEEGKFVMDAGENSAISVNNNGIVFSNFLLENKDNITNMSATFKNKREEEKLEANVHMHTTSYNNISKDINIYSRDINFDKEVLVTLSISFNDGGLISLTKEILVKGNLEIDLVTKYYSSGGNINLGDVNNFTTKRNGVVASDVLLDSDFGGKYTSSSFKYDNTYLFRSTNLEESMESILILTVQYGEESREIEQKITFTYVASQNGSLPSYELEFVFNLTLNIQRHL